MQNFPGPTVWDPSSRSSANILTTLLVTKLIQNEKNTCCSTFFGKFIKSILNEIFLASYEKTTFVLVHSFGNGDRFCVSLPVPLQLRQFSPRRNLEKASRHFCRYLCFPQSLNKCIQISYNGLIYEDFIR